MKMTTAGEDDGRRWWWTMTADASGGRWQATMVVVDDTRLCSKAVKNVNRNQRQSTAPNRTVRTYWSPINTNGQDCREHNFRFPVAPLDNTLKVRFGFNIETQRPPVDEPMGSGDEVVEIENLERALLSDKDIEKAEDDNSETVLYTASFREKEDNFVKYQTARWVLYSLLLILAWGIGLFMLLYLPVRRYILRKDIRSRKLYLTPNAIVYKVTRPVPFPCFGELKKEKHVLLPSVRDIVIEQGKSFGVIFLIYDICGVIVAMLFFEFIKGSTRFVQNNNLVAKFAKMLLKHCLASHQSQEKLRLGYLQSLFGVYSLRIENVGVRRPPSDDVQIQGIANPSAFRKAVLTRISNMRSEVFSRQASAIEDIPKTSYSSLGMSPSKSVRHDVSPYSGDVALLQKLEEVESSVKRVQTLMEEQQCQTSQSVS
ncbi:hypothetical protein Patl1_13649 [Pistacia atlantica]|uniref:Uncharacterized protein n=1 Tax=Pistacia atlantica TaxID=434234 RepID=A0ACC1AW45_9ROSI|nr:hypothetical protein Patl1_13649 [Pistacia atlantica]